MTDKVFIHVGLPKTGSKFLQMLVMPNVDEIQLITRGHTVLSENFNKLQFSADEIYDKAAFKAEVVEMNEAKGSKPLLISEEIFVGMAKYAFINRTMIADRLAEAMPNAEVILVLRGQETFLASLHAQGKKTGWNHKRLDKTFLGEGGKPFTKELSEKMPVVDLEYAYFNHKVTFHRDHFDYYKLIKLYESKFKKVHILLYEDLKADSKGYLKQFCDIIGIDVPKNVELKTMNKRQSKFRRKLKSAENIVRVIGVRNVIMKNILLGIFMIFTGDKTKSHFTKADYKRMFGESNQKLSQEYPEIGLNQHKEAYFLD